MPKVHVQVSQGPELTTGETLIGIPWEVGNLIGFLFGARLLRSVLGPESKPPGSMGTVNVDEAR